MSFAVSASAPSSLEATAIAPDAPGALTIELPEAGAIVARISDDQGRAIACKVQFVGRGEAAAHGVLGRHPRLQEL